MSQFIQELDSKVTAELELQKQMIVKERAYALLAEHENEINRIQEDLTAKRASHDEAKAEVDSLFNAPTPEIVPNPEQAQG